MRHFLEPVLLSFVVATTCSAAKVDVWIGTGKPRNGRPAGIYHLKFNDEAGKLSKAELVAEQRGAGFLAKHPTLPVLYSTGNGVSSWQISHDDSGMRLERINSQPTGDGGAAHIAVDKTGKVLFSAQYGGGSVTSYPLAVDGSIGEHASLIEHEDPSGVVAKRQASCHPHWVGTSPDNQYLLVPDLGADKIYVHRLDIETGKLSRHGLVDTPPGGGPRHFKFHPSGKIGYLVNELAMSLSVLNWNANDGTLKLSQTVPTLSAAQIAGENFNSGSEVRVHPSGKFVYSANRGHDTISAFFVDAPTGKLTLIEQEPIRGSWPRNFNLDLTGKWLLAAGANSNTLTVFAIDQETGALRFNLETQSVPAPICVLVTE